MRTETGTEESEETTEEEIDKRFQHQVFRKQDQGEDRDTKEGSNQEGKDIIKTVHF